MQRFANCLWFSQMIRNITRELAEALHASEGNEIEVIDPETQQRYVLIGSEIYHQAKDALRREQDRHAIATGLAQMEAGQGKPLDAVFSELRSRLGFPQSQ